MLTNITFYMYGVGALLIICALPVGYLHNATAAIMGMLGFLMFVIGGSWEAIYLRRRKKDVQDTFSVFSAEGLVINDGFLSVTDNWNKLQHIVYGPIANKEQSVKLRVAHSALGSRVAGVAIGLDVAEIDLAGCHEETVYVDSALVLFLDTTQAGDLTWTTPKAIESSIKDAFKKTKDGPFYVYLRDSNDQIRGLAVESGIGDGSYTCYTNPNPDEEFWLSITFIDLEEDE